MPSAGLLAVFAAAVLSSGIYALLLRLIFPHAMVNIAPEQMKLMTTLPIPAALAIAVDCVG